MKKIIIVLALVGFVFTSCKGGCNKKERAEKTCHTEKKAECKKDKGVSDKVEEKACTKTKEECKKEKKNCSKVETPKKECPSKSKK
ncbi:MAG: hypothetical protein KGV59_02025 [Tenacibaculum sp.]|nr:hypothetical protein [Tenacibaculum sp.]